MTITNGYCTLAELRARLGYVSTDTADDAMLEAVVMGVSRLIDRYTGRRFYTTSADETRYYTAEDSYTLFLPDDLVSVTTLSTDEDGDRTYEYTWAVTDYDLEPANAALDGQPYTRIEVTPEGAYLWPVGIRRGVKIVGKFGLAAAPADVKEACLLQSERVFKRKDAPFGVVGSAEMGQALVIPKLDPDVALLLAGHRRMGIGGV